MEDITNSVLEAMLFRHACKEFREGAVIPKEDFAVILEAARLSPSSFGFEPWSILVVQDMEIRNKLLPVCWGAQKQLPTASHFCILLARRAGELAPDSGYMQHMMRDVQQLSNDLSLAKAARVTDYLKNDIRIWGNDAAMFDWACRQTYIALGNMMTAAAFLKIDSCPIEGFVRHNVEEILEQEGVLDRSRFGVSCMAAFGYRKSEPQPKKRRTQEEVIRWI